MERSGLDCGLGSFLDAEKTRQVMTGFHIDYDQIPNERHAAVALLTKLIRRESPANLNKQALSFFIFIPSAITGTPISPRVSDAVHSALKGRDLFGELTRACLDEGILPGCVYEFSDNRIRVDHPAWCHSNVKFVDHKKTDITDANIGTSIAGPLPECQRRFEMTLLSPVFESSFLVWFC